FSPCAVAIVAALRLSHDRKRERDEHREHGAARDDDPPRTARAGDLARHLCRLQPRPAWGRPRGRRCVAPRGARPQSGDARGNRPGAGADLGRRSPPDRGGPRRPRAGPHHRHPAAAKTGPRGAPVAAAVRGAVGPRRPHGGPATGGRSPAAPPRAGPDGAAAPRGARGPDVAGLVPLAAVAAAAVLGRVTAARFTAGGGALWRYASGAVGISGRGVLGILLFGVVCVRLVAVMGEWVLLFEA